MSKKPPVCVVVDGLIAAGKSTFVRALARALTREGYQARAVLEPVDLWRETGILERFYQDPARYGYAFQTFAFATRVDAICAAYANAADVDVFIFERSPATDCIFMALLEDTVDPIETKMYAAWRDCFTRVLPFDLADATVLFLTPSLDRCMERLAARGRTEEVSNKLPAAPGEEGASAAGASAAGGVSRAYQQRLLRAHEALFWGLHTPEFPSLHGVSPFRAERVLALEPSFADMDFREESPQLPLLLAEVLRRLGLPPPAAENSGDPQGSNAVVPVESS